VATVLVVVAVVVAYILAGEPYGPIQAFVVLACGAVARRRPARAVVPACAAGGTALAGALWTRLEGADPLATGLVLLAWPAVFVVVPALVGALVRARAEAAEQERLDLLARGAYEERLRVAREVHDIAGHGFAVVALQAGMALTVFDEQPAQARAALEAIHASSRHALGELQGALDDLPDAAPDAGAVAALVERVRAGGQPVELRVTGSPDGLDVRVAATAYRLVQEALTNVTRHAGPTTASVAVDYAPHEVAVRVSDRGAGGGAGATGGRGEGRGLRGLRDRVEGLGGTFRAGDGARGGFEVVARMPRLRDVS
jgi:signal transduction histidine kinase